MADLLAGTTVKALDTPPTVADTQNDSFSFDSTTFGVDADSGTYVECAVVFTAPTTGRAKVHFSANLDNSSAAASTSCAPYVREGSSIGAGADVAVAALEIAVRNVGTDDRRYGSSLLLEGLTPGSSYNARLEHRVSGGTGTIQYRHLYVEPAT